MREEEIKEIESLLEKIDGFDLEKLIVEKFGEKESIDGIFVKDYIPIADFIIIYNKVIDLFKKILQSPERWLFSKAIRTDNYGGVHIDRLLKGIITSLENSNLDSLYEMVFQGFSMFNKINLIETESLNYKTETSRIKKLSTELELQKEVINKNLVLNKKDKKEFEDLIEKSKNELVTLKSEIQKTNEQLERDVDNANKDVEAISKLLNSGTASEQEIKNFTKNFDTEYKKLERLAVKHDKTFSNLQKEYESNLKKVNGFTSSIDEKYKEIEDKSEDFDTQLERLNELLGKEAASSLFSTFQNRKKELDKPVRNWMLGVIGASIFALAWIIAVFTNFFGFIPGNIKIDTTFLILNSLKSLPAIILLYFTIRQYVRERNMQEEYAFRSAIALTIDAYSDLLDENKDELIMGATSTIYNLPVGLREKGVSLFHKRDNALLEMIKELKETIKAMKS